MLDLFVPPKPPAVYSARRVLLLDAAGEVSPDLGQLQPRRPSKFDGMSADEIREYRRKQYEARRAGRSHIESLNEVKPLPKPEKKRRTKQTREQRNARRRELYREQKAQGKLFKQGKKVPYSQLPEEEKNRLRDYQTARYHANRERELERAKRRYAALTDEQRAAKRLSNEEWRKANRARVNAQDRARRAAKKAQKGGGIDA